MSLSCSSLWSTEPVHRSNNGPTLAGNDLSQIDLGTMADFGRNYLQMPNGALGFHSGLPPYGAPIGLTVAALGGWLATVYAIPADIWLRIDGRPTAFT